ncbi:MAG TPA: LptF/LptG family permease [Terriglobales bacterium]|nr:LptF/LptG family permease [Terriglobales bacterium]
MRILTRYILREVLSHAAIGAAVFTFIFFMRDIGRILELIVRQSAPLSSVIKVFAYTLPATLTFTIPMAVLVGILIGLSRLAADSEITAMRSSGMGALAFVRVIFILVIGAWFLALFNNAYLAPRSAAALDRLQAKLTASQASFEIQPRVFYEDLKNYVLYVQDASPGEGAALWKGVFLADISNPSAPRITVAHDGLVINEGGDRLRLHLRQGAQHETVAKQPDQYQASTFAATDIVIPLPSSDRPKTRQITPVTQAGTVELWRLAKAESDPFKQRLLLIEFHRRLAFASACLVLALVGIPLGLSSKRGGKSTGFVLTIALVFLYYFAMLAGMALARQGRMPVAPAIWMGNILFLIGGFLLLWRVDKMPIEIASMKSIWARLKTGLGAKLRLSRGLSNGSPYDRLMPRRRVLHTKFPLIIDDLILKDFMLYLGMILATFLVLLLVFTFFELLKDIIANRVPLILVGEYLINVTPYMIYNMMPLSVLLAVLVTFGLMQKSNEITAMKATGISIYRVIVPVLTVSMLIAIGLFAFDQFYLPKANKRQDALRNQIKGKPPQTYLRPDRKWIFGENNTMFYYEFFDADQNRFGSISVFEFDPATFELKKRIYATRAHWGENLGKWVFEQGWERSLDGSTVHEYRTFDVATFAEVNEPPSYFLKEVKQSSEMNYAELKRYIHELQQSGFDVVRLRVQLQKKFSYPLITFVMAVLAIPFALSTAKRGALTGVAVAIGIAAVYWISSGLFEGLGNANQLPAFLAAWSPDVIFALVGGYMILKVPT